MAHIIDWQDTNSSGTAQRASFEGITLEVNPEGRSYVWQGSGSVIVAYMTGKAPNLATARREAEQWARGQAELQAELATPESTPKATTQPGAYQLLDAKLARARAIYVAMGTMAADHALRIAVERHGVLSREARTAQALVNLTSGDLGRLFDLEMLEVEQSEAARAELVAKGKRP